MPYIIIGLIVILICFIVIRALLFKPEQQSHVKTEHEIDEHHAYESLSKFIQFKTVSYEDPQLIDENSFENLRTYLFERYPEIVKKAEFSMHGKGMLFKIKGKTSLNPVILMSHYDVVPASDGWQDDPFSGKITDSTIYGRGALDTKHSLNAILESVHIMLIKGHSFQRDLYLSFGGDEETYGQSQIHIVNHLKEQGVNPYFVLDEGGAIVSDIFPGVKEKTAVIGIAEKGFLNVKLVAKSQGGHASTPPKQTPIVLLSKAVDKLNQHPSFKLRLTTPVKALFQKIAPYSKSFVIRLLFANLWLFLPLVKMIAKLSGGEFLSLFKTTQAFTMMKGSDAINVLPSEANISINYRLIPGETSNIIVERIKKIIKDPMIDVIVAEVNEASTISKMDEPFHLIEDAIKRTWPDVITAPYLMIATSDSRRYHQISDHVYKFSPMDVSNDDLAKIHGFDEDISKENVINGIHFYLNLLAQI
jgi:carboxypeptidase PM20D1